MLFTFAIYCRFNIKWHTLFASLSSGFVEVGGWGTMIEQYQYAAANYTLASPDNFFCCRHNWRSDFMMNFAVLCRSSSQPCAFAPGALALATLLSSAPQGLCTPVGCGLCPVQIGHMGDGTAFSLVWRCLFSLLCPVLSLKMITCIHYLLHCRQVSSRLAAGAP